MRVLRILFAMQSPDYLRFYDKTIELLAKRGHSVAIAVSKAPPAKGVRVDQFAAPENRISDLGRLPKRKDVWATFAKGLRGTMDFVRYLDPRYRHAPVLRARIKHKVLPGLLHPLDHIRSLPRGAVRGLLRLLAQVERCIPTDAATDRLIAKHRFDLVLVTPLIDPGSPLVDVVRSARAEGIPVAVCIASWDNLTNKGHLRIVPDQVIVWNEIQKREAIELHGVPADRIALTGAQTFDRWFNRAPSRSRDAFCQLVGLPSERPFVLFVGSSSFITKTGDDVAMVRKWIQALRQSSDPLVRDAGVLVRPHPYYCTHWADVDLSDLDAVVWPRTYTRITDPDNRTDYFDTLFHSAAVVGINTSAMIEAAILGKPVHTILDPDFSGTQEGTLHFRYLLPENGGFLWVGSSLAEHVEKVGQTLRGDYDVGATRRFVEAFVRPHGIDQPCVPILADAIERSAGPGRKEPGRRPFWALAGGWLLAPLAAISRALEARRKRRRAAKTPGVAI